MVVFPSTRWLRRGPAETDTWGGLAGRCAWLGRISAVLGPGRETCGAGRGASGGGVVGEGWPRAVGGGPGGLAAGSRIAWYLLEEEVGAGGMAVVFRARDERLGRPVAVKVLAPGLAGDEEFRRRFLREARAAAAVDDPHIIPVYEAGQAGGVLFLAMRYVSGGDVRGLLRREGSLPLGRAAAIISPVACALDAAHGAGLVHRDVKPANMLIDARPGRPDHVYLSDFGLAKAGSASVLTGAGPGPGTVAYMAPEQIQGQQVDGRADQYALGCAAFELLAGGVPFERDQDMAVIYAHLSEPPPPLSARRAGLPPPLDEVLGRALAKAPEDRYASCGEFAGALREAMGLPGYDRDLGAVAAQAAVAPGQARGAPDAAAGATVVGTARAQFEAAAQLRRTISVVFADLVGSTVLGESLDAEALRHVTDRYFEVMRRAAERHGGSVEEFIGDAVVAVFGMPRVREDDALRAVRAAAEMRTLLVALNDELGRDLAVALAVRIGVNTGEVIVGGRGAGGSAVTGDAVNVAARLEQAAGPGEVLLGDSTLRLVRGEVTVEPAKPLQLTGKARPVAAWRLVDVTGSDRSANTRPANLFVGRDAQLRLLDEAFGRVAGERACLLVTVLGNAGMGKTRLAQEFVARLSEATVLMGRCLSYGQGATYWPVREAVLGAAGLTGDEPAGAAEAAFVAVLGDSPDTAHVVTRLLALTGFNRQAAVPEDVPWAMRLFLEQLAKRRPVVLVVDDLHWAEPGLLDVLEHIADWSRDYPIMLLGLARPEFYDGRPAWGGGKLNATALLLSALDAAATVSLVDQHDLPEMVKRRIVDTAEGNPLFVEQLVAMLVDEGYASSSNGVATWIGGPAGQVGWAMPPSVSALLAARIDRLNEDERAVVGAAAVIGTVFYAEAIAAITGTPLPDVKRVLAALIRKELLRAAVTDLPGVPAYRFLHVLVRDAAYDGLVKASRADWHERLADWLSANGSDAVPDEIMGHHLASAWEYRAQLGASAGQLRELAARAARMLAAASRRLELSDTAAAAALLQRAADLLEPDDPFRVECLLSLGAQRHELGEIARAQQALRLAAETGDSRQAVLAEVLMCLSSLTTSARAEDKEHVVGEAIRRFQEEGDDHGLAQAYLVQADLAMVAEYWSRATKLVELALRHGEAAGDVSCVARARTLLTLTMMFGPTPAEEAIASLDQMVASSGNDPRVRAEAEQVICLLHAMCGRFGQARALSGAARQHLAEVGHGLFLANLAQSTGPLEELAGNLDAAEHEYAQSCADLQALGEASYLSTVAGMHARLLARRGKLAQAQLALELARTHGSPDDVATQSLIRQAEGLLAAAAGQADHARAAVSDALKREPQNQAPDAAGEAFRTAAEIERLLGETVRERAHLAEARSLFKAKGNVVRAQEVNSRLQNLVIDS